MDGCSAISVSSCVSIVMSVCNHAYNNKKIIIHPASVRECCFKDVDQMEIGHRCSLILPVMPRGKFILKVLQHISSCHDSLHKNLHSRKSKRKLVVLYLQRPLR